MPGFPVHQQLLERAQTHVHGVSDAIQPSCPLSFPSPPAFSFPASGSFSMSQFFASGGQSIGASASTSKLNLVNVSTGHTFYPFAVVNTVQQCLHHNGRVAKVSLHLQLIVKGYFLKCWLEW